MVNRRRNKVRYGGKSIGEAWGPSLQRESIRVQGLDVLGQGQRNGKAREQRPLSRIVTSKQRLWPKGAAPAKGS